MDKLDELIEKHRAGGGSIIGLLQDICQEEHYLSRDALTRVSEQMDVPLSRLYGLATFYASFRLEPIGKNHVCVCVGTACHVNGAEELVASLCRRLGVEPGGTTEDGQFTLDTVNCVGACALGPLVVINGEYHGNVEQSKIDSVVEQYENA